MGHDSAVSRSSRPCGKTLLSYEISASTNWEQLLLRSELKPYKFTY